MRAREYPNPTYKRCPFLFDVFEQNSYLMFTHLVSTTPLPSWFYQYAPPYINPFLLPVYVFFFSPPMTKVPFVRDAHVLAYLILHLIICWGFVHLMSHWLVGSTFFFFFPFSLSLFLDWDIVLCTLIFRLFSHCIVGWEENLFCCHGQFGGVFLRALNFPLIFFLSST